MTDKEQINNFAKDINVPRKEQIIIDGIDVSGCEFYVHYDYGRFSHGCSLHKDMFGLPVYCDIADCCEDCYFKQLARKTQECEQQQKTLDELIGCVSIWEGFTEEESKLAKDSSIADLIMLLRKKTQECEKLEDFRTLTREVFTFGDSDVDDENFIKYLQEYSRSYEEAIDGYYRLTNITGIDYTVHGGADIEEIIKRVDILKQECEELKKQLMQKSEVDMFFNTPIEGWSNDPCGICPHKAENEVLKKEIINKNEKIKELRFSVSDLTNRLCSLNAEKSFRIVDLEQALEEIEKVINNILNSCLGRNTVSCRPAHNVCGDLINILDIVNKAKEQ